MAVIKLKIMTIEEAIKKSLTGNCLLFTGSGFGYGAKNIKDQELLLGSGLADLLYDKCGIVDHDGDLKSASDLFLDERGEYELIELLKHEFTIKSISEDHKLIGSLPWKRIYTTNYDDILEKSFNHSGNLLTPISLGEKIDQYKDFRKLCVHLNGYINALTPTKLNREFKLTNTSYLTTEFINSQWVDLFRSDVHTSDVIIFIGFSTSSDLDISRILAEKVTSIKDRCFFIVGPDESQLNVKKLSKFGHVHKIGLNGFSKLISEIGEDFDPPKEIAYSYKSFTKIREPRKIPALRDIDFHSLVLLGNMNMELTHQSIINSEKYPYFLFREENDELFEKIKEGHTDFVIHSGLGNGKTCFLNGMAAYGVHKGFQVYIFQRYYDVTNNEVEKICSQEGNILVIIENYSNHFDLIKKFKLFRKSNVVLLLSERSIINDTVYFTLEEIIGEDYISFNLNHMNSEEVTVLSDLLSSYGLWGKDSSYSIDFKHRKISNEFKSSMRLTLLDVLKSPDIQKRLTNLIDPLIDNKPLYHASLLIISSNILGFSMTLEELIYILDDELLNNPSFYNNQQLREMIDFKNNKITINSPILAEGILHTNKYHHDLIPLLVKVVKKLDNSRFNRNHFSIIKSIVSHSRLQKLFNTRENNDFRKLVIQFFEEIKNLDYSRRNPFFWLQYAMARLEIRDYKVADQYFDTAYSWAKKIDNFDTFQIDNHYARHLVENEVYNGNLESCMPQFIKAHKILGSRSDHNKNRHYPFKVARNYARFYDHYFSKLEQQDKKIFLISCQEILHRIDDYNSVVAENYRNRVVQECFDDLSGILIKERDLFN